MAKGLRPAIWKHFSLWSAFLVFLCVAVGYVDELTHFKLEFIDDYYDVIAIAGLISATVCVVSLVGWARQLDKRGRIALAFCVLLWPWVLCLIGYLFDGFNPHGAAAPLLVSIVPTFILSLVFFTMAAFAKDETEP
jgi:hypothetical protein